MMPLHQVKLMLTGKHGPDGVYVYVEAYNEQVADGVRKRIQDRLDAANDAPSTEGWYRGSISQYLGFEEDNGDPSMLRHDVYINAMGPDYAERALRHISEELNEGQRAAEILRSLQAFWKAHGGDK